jgi:tetratricopeptide (TPR) repeat protein
MSEIQPGFDSLLLQHFSIDDMRRSLREYRAGLEHDIAWDKAKAVIVFEVNELLERHRAFHDPEFYRRLAAYRPGLSDQLILIAARHSLCDLKLPIVTATDTGDRIDPRAGTSTIPQQVGPFVGRTASLEAIAAIFADNAVSVLVLAGLSGVGKSALACHYARTHHEAFTYTFHISLRHKGPPEDLDIIGHSLLGPSIATLPPERRCKLALNALASHHCLLVYDDVVGPDELKLWLPPSRSLCRVLATSTATTWTSQWHSLVIPPLSTHESTDLVAALVANYPPHVGLRICDEYAPDLVLHAGGLPVQLVPATIALADRLGGDAKADYWHTLAADAEAAFELPWSTLDERSRLVLSLAAIFRPDHIPPDELEHLGDLTGIDRQTFEPALGAARRVRLIERSAEMAYMRMHPRVHEFVRKRAPVTPAVLAAAFDRFVAAARAARKAPTDALRLKTLRNYPQEPLDWPRPLPTPTDPNALLDVSRLMSDLGNWLHAHAWAEVALATSTEVGIPRGIRLLHLASCKNGLRRFSDTLSLSQAAVTEFRLLDGDPGRVGYLADALHKSGRALVDLHRYDEAIHWLTLAIDTAMKLPPASYKALDQCYHSLALCHQKAGRYVKAREFYQQAVVEKEQLDHRSAHDCDALGTHVNGVGYCHYKLQEYEQAEQHFLRSIGHIECGDQHGRKDHNKLNLNYSGIAMCYFNTQRYEPAIPWFDRAIEEGIRGDRFGVLDHINLAMTYRHLAICYIRINPSKRNLEIADTLLSCALHHCKIRGIDDAEARVVLGTIYYHQGVCHFHRKKFTSALECFQLAVRNMEGTSGHFPHDLHSSYSMVGKCLDALHRHKDAKRAHARAREIKF